MIHTFPRWRLRLISVLAILVVCTLLYRIFQIQVFEHEKYRKKAKKQWHRKIPRQARRGSIYSRDGLPLAVTQKTYTLGVTPGDFPRGVEAAQQLAVIAGTGVRAVTRALQKDCRYVQLGRDLHLTQEDIERVCVLSGVRLDPKQDRLYPFNALPSRFIGNGGWDGNGISGVELAFDEDLRGEDGWSLTNMDAKYGTFQLENAPGKKPRNGNDLFLTIDSRVQLIADFELGQAVERYGAAGGVVIMLDPYRGDVLALSEKISPGSASGFYQSHKDALYSVSCIYEPGSTFKVVTDSYLIEKGTVNPYDVFYGEEGVARFDFGVFHDDHPFGWLTFKESFIHSSNICTIKAVLNADPVDFYSYILRFGFAGKTGVAMSAESSGRLLEPGKWSARSLPSISIGHEIGVTPFQMAMAYCAIANGGTLLAPRIALEERDEEGRVVKSFPPIKVRRVFSKKTAETLKGFCTDVVAKGTGQNAAVSGIPVAGKTGTAQKASSTGYLQGRYTASFIGFAPVENPQIVCLVLLDEPAWRYHWGGQSATVVFSRIIEGLNLTTDFFFHENDGAVAYGYERNGKIAVPNFLRRTPGEAVRIAARWGLQIHCSGEQGIIYSQIPDPGTLVEGGEEVRLIIMPRTAAKNETVSVPDLRGLSIREARRLLLACGLKCRITGYGVVRNQLPHPGKTVKRGREVSLQCRPKTVIRHPGELDLVGRVTQ